MARKIKQISTAITNDSFFITALCEDNSIWVSVDWREWEMLTEIPSDSQKSKKS